MCYLSWHFWGKKWFQPRPFSAVASREREIDSFIAKNIIFILSYFMKISKDITKQCLKLKVCFWFGKNWWKMRFSFFSVKNGAAHDPIFLQISYFLVKSIQFAFWESIAPSKQYWLVQEQFLSRNGKHKNKPKIC